MPGSAMASGTVREPSNDRTITYEKVDHWLLDSDRLTTWQIQLVDCCQAINEQLKQIRNGLEAPHVVRQAQSPVAFRLIGEGNLPSV